MNSSDEGMASAIEAEPPCKSVSNERKNQPVEEEGLIEVFKVGCGNMCREVKLLAIAIARDKLRRLARYLMSFNW